jgi:hypothetical protein
MDSTSGLGTVVHAKQSDNYHHGGRKVYIHLGTNEQHTRSRYRITTIEGLINLKPKNCNILPMATTVRHAFTNNVEAEGDPDAIEEPDEDEDVFDFGVLDPNKQHIGLGASDLDRITIRELCVRIEQ